MVLVDRNDVEEVGHFCSAALWQISVVKDLQGDRKNEVAFATVSVLQHETKPGD